MSKYSASHVWVPASKGFNPNQTLDGRPPDDVAAGRNVIFEAENITRAVRNPLDRGITNGTAQTAYSATVTAGSAQIVATGGAFLTDLVPFQFILHNRLLYVVTRVIDNNNALIAPTPSATATAVVKFVPNLHTVNDQRVSLLAGNVAWSRNALWAVGRGAVYLDGATLPPSSLVATSTPKVAYATSPIAYSSHPVGFDRPAAPTLANVAGGSKGMKDQTFSVRISRKRAGELGYGYASEPALVTLAAVSERVAVTFPAYDAAQGQNRWLVWVTKESPLSTSTGGPWFEYQEIDSNAGTVNIEWRTGELGANYVEDIARPPDPALCVAASGDVILWGSTQGLDASGNPSVPGSIVEASTPTNPEGYPSSAYVETTNGQHIVSLKAGRINLFTGCVNSIQYATLTKSTSEPLSLLPFLPTGILHQYQMVIGADVCVIFTGGRLVGVYDQVTLQESPLLYQLSQRLTPYLQDVPEARALLGFDPKRNLFVQFVANAEQGAGGGWRTMALSFDIKTGRANTPVYLGNGTDDFTVTGCATIRNGLEFVTSDGKTWAWDEGTGNVTGHLASAHSAYGSRQDFVTMRQIAVTGKLDGRVSVLSSNADTIDNALLEQEAVPTGVPSRLLTNLSYLRKVFLAWMLNRKAKAHAVRIDFTVPGGNKLIEAVEIECGKRSEPNL